MLTFLKIARISPAFLIIILGEDPGTVCCGWTRGRVIKNQPEKMTENCTPLINAGLTSHVAMFADDTKIYNQIKSQEHAAYLQADLIAG